MPLLNACCCFKTLKAGARATAWFTVLTGLINCGIDIATIVHISYFRKIAEPQTQYLYLPPGITTFISIELVSSIFLVIFGIGLHIGVNFGYEGKRIVYSWIVFILADRFYDCFLGIYILSWIGGHRFTEVIYVIPECTVLTMYWILDTIIMAACLLYVISYWQELKDCLFGKERRLKYYNKLANIRNAATSGKMTPYKSYYNSRSLLGLSENQSLLSLDDNV